MKSTSRDGLAGKGLLIALIALEGIFFSFLRVRNSLSKSVKTGRRSNKSFRTMTLKAFCERLLVNILAIIVAE